MTRLKDIAGLLKWRISLMASGSAVAGFFLAGNTVNPSGYSLFFGFLSLCCGASALNHVQDRDIDRQMPRTSSRPIPTGRVRPSTVLLLASCLIASGLTVLFLAHGSLVFFLGLSGLMFYNGIYAWLRRRSVWGTLIGSLAGAAPPMAGWVAGGGSWSTPAVYVFVVIGLFWQIPHLMLLHLRHGEDYKSAELPTLLNLFDPMQLTRILGLWILCFATAALYSPLFFPTLSAFSWMALLASSGVLIYQDTALMRNTKADFRYLFRAFNVYVLVVMLLLGLANVPLF